MNNISGIYEIRSISHPERVYIGSSYNTALRWRGHRSLLNAGKHHSPKLQHHYNKHGADDLTFKVIMECDEKYLIDKEQFFIDLYHPWFNISPRAGTQRGSKRSKEILDRMRKNRKPRTHSHESKKKISESHLGSKNPFYGKQHSTKTKELFSRQRLNNKYSGHMVINLETGIFYNSICEVARATNIKYGTLWAYLSGKHKNRTMFALV